MIATYLFYLLSFVGILCALLMVWTKNPVHSILYLIGTFFTIAGHYFLLNAQFLGVIHIIVYAGAIMVLFLYVIMMMNLNVATEPLKSNLQKITGTIATGLLGLVLVVAARNADLSMEHNKDVTIGYVENLGKILFSDYLVPFEISSILLLGSMVGAVFLSKKVN